MKTNTKGTMSTRTMVLMAMLSALVVILTWMGNFIRLSPLVTVSLSLLPIVLGAVLCGPMGGMWLGFVSGVIVLVSGQAGWFFTFTPLGTIAIVLLKGTACGLAAGLIYRLLQEKNRYLGVILAAVICPIVNTGIYLFGCITIFMPLVQTLINDANPTLWMALIYGMGLINFPFELLFNIVLCPVIYRLIRLLPKFSKA